MKYSTSVVQHDEARMVAFNLHWLICPSVIDLYEMTARHYVVVAIAVHHFPLDVGISVIFVSRNDSHDVSVRTTANVTFLRTDIQIRIIWQTINKKTSCN